MAWRRSSSRSRTRTSQTILDWADEERRLRVYANADTPEDARRALENGAEGIGLCRTEHMFMAADRLPIVREMILARRPRTGPPRSRGCCRCSRRDFEGIFEAMAGLPVTIRLLDPPLHEFLPDVSEVTDDAVRERIEGVARDEPDARNAWLSSRARVAGDLRDADSGDRPRRRMRSQSRTALAPTVEIMHPLVGFASELERLSS